MAVRKDFGLTYRDRDNAQKTPLGIHRAPLGTHERFIGFLIEHYAGNFPLWLAPEQVRVLTLNDDEKLVAYAKEIHRELRANEVRVETDFSAMNSSKFCNSPSRSRPWQYRRTMRSGCPARIRSSPAERDQSGRLPS